jgi:hypothetical protein
MSLGDDEVIWWCIKCEIAVLLDFAKSHGDHKDQIVGVRHDIMMHHMRRLVSDLKRTNRLITTKPKG